MVRLLVLGVVRLHGRAHGYAIQRTLADWHVETWTSVKPGSIYHALKQLAKEQKLRAMGTEDSPEGPARLQYELTPAGEQEFLELLVAALSSFGLEDFGAGVAFMQALPRTRVLEILRDRAGRASANQVHLDGLMEHFPDRSAEPHMQDLLSLWSGHLEGTARWTARLIARLEAGEYVMACEGK